MISEKSGEDSNWILYGDIADYIQDVFDHYQLNEVINESDFFELEQALIDMKFTPGNLNKFIETAELIIPNFKDRKSTRLNSSHVAISYTVYCWQKQKRE